MLIFQLGLGREGPGRCWFCVNADEEQFAEKLHVTCIVSTFSDVTRTALRRRNQRKETKRSPDTISVEGQGATVQPGGLTPGGWVSESDRLGCLQVLRVAAGPITAAAAAATAVASQRPDTRPSPDRSSCANHVTPEIRREGSQLATGLVLTRPLEGNVVLVSPVSTAFFLGNGRRALHVEGLRPQSPVDALTLPLQSAQCPNKYVLRRLSLILLCCLAGETARKLTE